MPTSHSTRWIATGRPEAQGVFRSLFVEPIAHIANHARCRGVPMRSMRLLRSCKPNTRCGSHDRAGTSDVMPLYRRRLSSSGAGRYQGGDRHAGIDRRSGSGVGGSTGWQGCPALARSRVIQYAREDCLCSLASTAPGGGAGTTTQETNAPMTCPTQNRFDRRWLHGRPTSCTGVANA